MCGEHSFLSILKMFRMGSSPHVRGALHVALRVFCPAGIIPACAGSTLSRLHAVSGRRDHPRMCGEHLSVVMSMESNGGSSPHVRGARRLTAGKCLTSGIIPACAGSTSNMPLMVSRAWDHPRMCGEHVSDNIVLAVLPGSSPHVRGALYGRVDFRHVPGIIPACAGSTLRK